MVIAVAVGAISLYWVAEERDRAIRNAERELENVAAILAEHTGRAFQSLDLVQTSIAEAVEARGVSNSTDLEREFGSQDVQQSLGAKISGLPQIDAITLIDIDGKLVNFSRYWPIPKVNVADRDYYQALRSESDLERFISEPVRNRGTGTWSIYNARKLHSRQGDFVGLVLGAVQLNYFERFFESISLGRESAINLFRADGKLLARIPRVDNAIGRPIGKSQLFGGVLASANKGVVRQKSNLDGLDRLIAARKVEHYPLVITVADTMSTVLSEWRDDAKLILSLAGVVEIMIVAAFLLVRRSERVQALALASRMEMEKERALVAAEIRHLKSESEASALMAAQNERFNCALENMSHGLTMFGPDQRLVICNRKYLELYGLPPSLGIAGTHCKDIVEAIVAKYPDYEQKLEEYDPQRGEGIAAGSALEKTIEVVGQQILLTICRPTPHGGWISTHEDITEKRKAEEKILYMARYDALTRLANRSAFNEALCAACERSNEREQFALLCIDLDEFKSINDALGHPVGDELLELVGHRLRGVLREDQLLARLGGDEFAILDLSTNQPASSGEIGGRIIEVLRDPLRLRDHQLEVGASIGIAVYPYHANTAEGLMKNADLALYRAKSDGRGQYRFFETEMGTRIETRRRMASDLRRALDRREFVLHYQPIVRLATYEPTGCEALVRWRHPERGIVSPSEFIPLAEETGLIGPLGSWVLEEACKEAVKWPNQLSVAVNLSPAQFCDAALVDIVRGALRTSGLGADRLELEITESLLLEADADRLNKLRALQQLGVKISLDDFGTGYSSLSYLRSFPFDKIKIDQSFVRELSSRKDCAAIVQAIVRLGSNLGIRTTAEGVETLDQLDRLRTEGCTEVQGYLFSAPQPASEISAMLGSLCKDAVQLRLVS